MGLAQAHPNILAQYTNTLSVGVGGGVYRIAGNFRWCKFSRKSVQIVQKKFSQFLFSRMRDALATPLPVDNHAPYANRRNDTE